MFKDGETFLTVVQWTGSVKSTGTHDAQLTDFSFICRIVCLSDLGCFCSFAGQVGYIITGMKDVKEAQIGDTLHLQEQPVDALPGFKPAKAMVFAGKSCSHPRLLLSSR